MAPWILFLSHAILSRFKPSQNHFLSYTRSLKAMAFLQLDAFNFDEAQGPTEDPLLAGVLLMPLEAQIHEISLSLLRQHIGKATQAMESAASNALQAHFERAYPRTTASIVNKKVVWKLLGINANDGRYNDNHSILSNLVGIESASAVACQYIRRTCEDEALITAVVSLLRVPQQPTDASLGAALSLDPSTKRTFLEMTVEYHLACGAQMGHDTYSTPKPYAFDHNRNELEVNGLRINESSSSHVVSKLSDLDIDNAIVLGRGAGGSVLKALHKPSGVFMAVKTIALDDNIMGQVISELSIVWGIADEQGSVVQRKESPFLVNCFGVFYSQCTLYIVMERMDGSLKDLLVPGGLSEDVCRAIAFQSLSGLSYMHDTLRQLHRDVKPHNILFRKADGSVKLSDFGISSTKLESVNLGKKSTFCGTLRYMSPMAVSDTEYGFEADLWSFGVTLIQLALGDLPYKGDSPFSIMSLRDVPPRLPEDGRFSPQFLGFISDLCDPSGGAPRTSHMLKHPWFAGYTAEKSRQVISSLV